MLNLDVEYKKHSDVIIRLLKPSVIHTIAFHKNYIKIQTSD